MRDECNYHRLRKYKRKKNSARKVGGKRWDRLALLYWRYHFKVYGPIPGWNELTGWD